MNIQKNHEYILVYRKQCNYIGTKVKPTLLNSAFSVKKILQEGEEFYYLNDPITTRGEGGVLNARKNLGYTVYYNPTTKDKKAVCDYNIELAKTSNDEDELYTDNEDLITEGYVPIRPPRVRGKLGAWTWDLDKFNKNKHLIVITENKRSKSYAVRKRTFVDKSEVYNDNGKLSYNLYSRGNSRSIIEFSTNDGTTALGNVLGESGTFNNPKNLEMIKYFLRLFPKRDALVLDFFAGSGTTGQAVIELNKDDGGERKFILCTNNQNNIAENVTYKRVSNIINGYEYQGKKESVLFEKFLNINDLNDMEKILEDVKGIEERSLANFTNIIKELKDGVFKLIGQDIIAEKVEGISTNFKYYKTDYIKKFSNDDDYDFTGKLLKHMIEMIQLEHAIKIDNKEYIILLTDEDADNIEQHQEILEKCKAIYISSQVLLTRSQEVVFDNLGIKLIPIPEYYFNSELREVGEL
ncbi:hypothetical protein CSV76_05765 [Sporosarcina sp. P17b]|nr:hypothetical protein CSV76_05765 [Sporosarcina sp. P17b]